MAQDSLMCDREQELLLPPSLRDWLPADHSAWFVLDVVEELDLAAFLAEYRQDGWGRAAFDPAMMVALMLYAYAIGERTSRAIERRCREDIAFRVITANQAPDHATIARFRVRHKRALGEVFTQVLGLCAQAGLVNVGLIAVDGTKIAGIASREANRSYEQIAREILEEAAAADADDDQRFGRMRGDELPGELADHSSRRARLRAAKQRLEAEVREAEDAHGAHLPARAELEAARRRKLRGRKPVAPPAAVDPVARANVTDPDSRLVRAPRGFVQGYNAQAVPRSQGHSRRRALNQLARWPPAGTDDPRRTRRSGRRRVRSRPRRRARRRRLLERPADRAGCRRRKPGDRQPRQQRPPDTPGRRSPAAQQARSLLYAHMQRVITSPHGAALYRRRQQMIEPIFAQTKVTRRADRFQRRGLAACRSEWRLIAATHNLLKLYRAAPATG